jgi:hypothetical protein
MSNAILFSQMNPTENVEAFHDWYNLEHVPARMALPGFVRARRFASLQGPPAFLAIYEVSGMHAFETPRYEALRAHPSELTRKMLASVDGFTRYVGEELSDTGGARSGAILSVNAFDVPEQWRGAFDDWYETEHIPRLMQCKDWLRVRRYRIVDRAGGNWTHLALHELKSREAMDSPERARARQGPKRARLAGQAWFSQSGRWLYETIFDTDDSKKS